MVPLISLAAMICCAQAPVATYRISGTVVDFVTGAALDRVKLRISPTSDHTRMVHATTGQDGRFAFEGLSAGKWVLVAQRHGYPLQTFGQEPRFRGPGVAIVTGPGEATDGIVFRLYPPGMISGKVTDRSGEPVESALVQVIRLSGRTGNRRASVVRTGWTTDDGAFAVGFLPPGSYYVAVTVDTEDMSDLGETGGAYPPHFYPSTADPRLAAPIQVRPGQDVSADFILSPAPAAQLTLRAPEGRPVRLRLGVEGVQGTNLWSHSSGSNSPVHTLRLVPGRYTVYFGGANQEQTSVQTVEFGSQDAEIDLVANEPANVEASVRLTGLPQAASASLGLVLRSEDGNFGSPRMIEGDGVSKLLPLAAGRYRLTLIGRGSAEAYIDSVYSTGARFAKGVIDLRPGATVRLRVVVSGSGGLVEGKVYRDGRPLPGVVVVLGPSAASGDPAHYKAFVTDSDGSFEYKAVKPGEYRVAVIEDESEFEYTDPEVIRPYLESGERVLVERGGSVNLRLQLPGSSVPEPKKQPDPTPPR